jgi:DNA topoisomerase IA
LYEAGHITYMRTDSTNLSQDALQNAREFIEHQFGQKYLLINPMSMPAKVAHKKPTKRFVLQMLCWQNQYHHVV